MGKQKIPEQRLCEIGNRLLELREKVGLTQEKMAEALEISKTHYALAEKGTNCLSLQKILLLYDKFDADLAYLLTGKKQPTIIVSDLVADCPKEKIFDMEQLIRYASNLYR